MPILIADDGVRLHCTSTGSGSLTVIFLHSMGGNIATWMPLWAAMDGTDIHFIALDFRGTGDSEREPCELSNERLARDILTVADHYGAKSFIIVGHSMGAKVGLFLTTVAPTRVRGLVLMGCPSPGMIPFPRSLLDEFLARPGDREFVEAFFRPWFSVWPRPEIDAWIDSFVRMPPWALMAACELSIWTDFRDRLAALSCPVLLMMGAHDPVYGPAYQRSEVLPHVPAAHVLTLDCGHGFMLERVEEVAPPLVAFLARLSGGDGNQAKRVCSVYL